MSKQTKLEEMEISNLIERFLELKPVVAECEKIRKVLSGALPKIPGVRTVGQFVIETKRIMQPAKIVKEFISYRRSYHPLESK